MMQFLEIRVRTIHAFYNRNHKIQRRAAESYFENLHSIPIESCRKCKG